jgi:hypothetical protein
LTDTNTTTSDSIPTENNVASYTIYVKCCYAGQCASEGLKCRGCVNNPQNQKQDHYQPIYPYYPYNPWYPNVFWCSSGSTITDTEGTHVILCSSNKVDYYKDKSQ